LPLQRAATDFGADASFATSADKLKEHYGIDVPISAIRLMTQKHAKGMSNLKGRGGEKEEVVISQTDGNLIPIVEMEGSLEDKRKNRKVCWKEVKLSCARGKDKIKRYYAGAIGSAEEAGERMLQCAILAGMREGTYVHAIGDGAPWIVEQFKLKFCNRGGYLIDFFHLCEYLAKASTWCDIFAPGKWLEESKEKLKTGKLREVFEEIKRKVEQLQIQDETSGLVQCYRYMEKRLDYMDYKSALDKGLPIGSGEIESAHRHVVQKRLKIAGAWWKINNANHMIGLRTGRINGYWETYWEEQRIAA
jgi:hypothetical protein